YKKVRLGLGDLRRQHFSVGSFFAYPANEVVFVHPAAGYDRQDRQAGWVARSRSDAAARRLQRRRVRMHHAMPLPREFPRELHRKRMAGIVVEEYLHGSLAGWPGAPISEWTLCWLSSL